jgi:tetratricopeptide (TPR) repeat protein
MDTMPITEQIYDHFEDEAWVNQHADIIYQEMRELIKDRKQVESIVTNLLLIYPALLNRGDLRKWVKLINRADRKLNRMALRRMTKPGYSFQQAYQITPVAAARAKPRKPRSERLNQREMFEVYLTLMMGQIFTHPEELRLALMDNALAFSRTLNDPYYTNKLYQTLAYIHLETHQFDQALNQARLAYHYWHGHPDTIEEGLTAFAIATAYRGLHNWELAQKWSHMAGSLLAKVKNPRSSGVVALEISYLEIYLQHYDSAYRWAETALKAFQTEEMQYHTGLVYRQLGLVQAANGQFDEAIDNLWRAINLWESLSDSVQQVLTEQVLAFAEARMSKKERALMRLERNRALCRHISPPSIIKHHLKRVDRLEEAIHEDTDLLNLVPEFIETTNPA